MSKWTFWHQACGHRSFTFTTVNSSVLKVTRESFACNRSINFLPSTPALSDPYYHHQSAWYQRNFSKEAITPAPAQSPSQHKYPDQPLNQYNLIYLLSFCIRRVCCSFKNFSSISSQLINVEGGETENREEMQAEWVVCAKFPLLIFV